MLVRRHLFVLYSFLTGSIHVAVTTLTSWALLIWQTLEERGADPRPFFLHARLDTAKLGDGNARYSMHRMAHLWSSLSDLDDDLIGVEVGSKWNPTTFHALGFAWLASNSLHDAFQRMTRYCEVVNGSLQASFEQKGPHYVITMATSEDRRYLHPFAADAGIAAVLKMCRMLCGDNFSPLEAHFARDASAGTRKLEHLLRTNVYYGRETACWILDRQTVEAKIPSGNSELARINEQLVEKNLVRLRKNDIVTQVRQSIVERLPSGSIDEDKVALDLNIAVRTLQRRLHDEGLNFSGLINQIREDLAKHYIDDTQISIIEISYLLGFSEQANFSRAFKRWTGVSPRNYRKQMCAESERLYT